MQDLYTFDADLSGALNSYEEICSTYDSLFNSLGLPFKKGINTF